MECKVLRAGGQLSFRSIVCDAPVAINIPKKTYGAKKKPLGIGKNVAMNHSGAHKIDKNGIGFTNA